MRYTPNDTDIIQIRIPPRVAAISRQRTGTTLDFFLEALEKGADVILDEMDREIQQEIVEVQP
jgi:ABC-type phosphate transport system auxiliary subunit